ncbi:InlB B-repeat-containing protein, partial [Clostridium tertium]|uniref:InlB B-repeat-containing protein n=1 Tax=Clostridium tertium TaxID=1559 RepID=UPI00374F5319
WNVNAYKVNYDSQGGSPVAEEDVEFDTLIKKPTDPTKEGYTFGGWYKDVDCTIPWDFDTDKMPSNNLTLYAKWNVNAYKVNYDSQGGSPVAEEDVEFDTLIKKPTDPTKEGYTFGGWYKDVDCTIPWDFDTDKMPSNNLTLYAKWNIRTVIINKVPTITASDKVLTLGDNFDPLAEVAAYDEEDGEITLTNANVIANNVDISK